MTLPSNGCRQQKEVLNLFNMAPLNYPTAAVLLLCCALCLDLLPQKVSGGRGAPVSTCAAGVRSIGVQEEFLDEDRGEVVYCRGTATVRHCEGQCISKSVPRLSEATGFHLNCTCCREERLVPQEMILTDCYDVSGNALMGRSYPVHIPEPDSCGCKKCTL
ncbi:partner of bursicon-like [Acanthaster planci]|uniref:Partner of bursicon-like n=1 Tax=Acanthaster planci TaxID=133434 RepID=A0A8B7XJ17_ACAPL|nr:partner of bursicon-like [Acanthaster planci]